MSATEFGAFVRQRREEKARTDPAFSLRQFAAALEVSPTFMSRMERGEFDPPGAEKIVKMAELLEVDRDHLFGLAGKTDPDFAEMVRSPGKGLSAFLRAARNLAFTEAEYRRALDAVMRHRATKAEPEMVAKGAAAR